MKTKIKNAATGAALLAAALIVAPGLYAAEGMMNNSATKPVVAAREKVGQKASKIIGEEVQSTSREDLGKVKDLVVDTRDGRVVYALISSGGVLGIGDKVHIVPFSAFKSGAESDGALILDLHGENWASAPLIHGQDLAMYAPDREGTDIYREFGRDWKKDLSAVSTSPGNSPSHLMRVSDLKGKEIKNGTQRVGEIQNVIVNFDRRHASALVDPNDDFTGTNQKFAVSFAKLSPSPADENVYLTSLTRDDFKAATPFNEADLTMTKLYPYTWSYSVSYMPVFPLERTPISQVRTVLKEDPVVGTAMKNVKMSTHEDQLTLTGAVRSEDIKNKVANRVEDVAQGWDVNNKLSVGLASK